MDIADAPTSNGDGNDGGFTPYHTEIQVKNQNLELYMNSNEGFPQLQINKTPQLLENMTMMAQEYTHLTITIENNYVGWDNNEGNGKHRSGYHRNNYMYVLDGRPLHANYGNKFADSLLYLGLNQVPHTRDTDKRGIGLCRTCVTIARKCPKADIEIDLATGMTWGVHSRIKIRLVCNYRDFIWRPQQSSP